MLIVDGLDEDRGAASGEFSIAALLPKNPPAGMRVVVTGRPNPPVPDDVPSDHPLRNPGIVRSLAPWPHAEGISNMARRELQRLLGDERIGNPLLGLLVVARGGLTGKDLADLVSVQPHQVDKLLRAITGRSFVPDDNGHVLATDAAGSRPHVLGHEELRQEALAGLGRTAAAEYEARLHAWADGYRAKGWPSDTPLYLLSDYPHMLHRAGDIKRLTSIVLDPLRQRALLARSSVDTALSEVELTRRVIRRASPGDLGALVALAASSDMLTKGARGLPPTIPVAFARLGYAHRAMALALAAPYPEEKAVRLAKVARVLASFDAEDAAQAAQEAARWAERARRESAPSSGDEYEAEVAAGEAAVALISVGQDREGRDLLDSLWPPAGVGETLRCEQAVEASLAAHPRSPALAEECLDLAERYADELVSGNPSDPTAPVKAWAAIAAAAGPARAATLYQRISEYADTFPACLESCAVHATAASALVAAHADHARTLAQQAAWRLGAALRAPEALSPDAASTLSMLLELMLTSVARALVDIGSGDDARDLVSCVPDTMRTGWFRRDVLAGARAAIDGRDGADETPSAEALAHQACRLAEQGRPDEAKSRLHEALEAFASSPGSSRLRETWLTTLCGALAASGSHADGERLARSLRDPVEQVRALAAVASSIAVAGYRAEAGRLAHEAADRARSLEGADNFSMFDGAPGRDVADAKGAAAQALAHAGERDLALSLAEEVGAAQSRDRRRALVAVAAALRTHDPATAARLVDRERGRLLAADAKPGGLGRRITELAELLAAIGDAEQECKERLNQAIKQVRSDQRDAAGKLSLESEDFLVLVVLAATEEREDARRALTTREQRWASAPPWEWPTGCFAIAHAIFGDYDAAQRAAGRHNVPYERAEAYAAVAAYLTRTPACMWSTSDSTSTAFTQTLRSLALLETPPSTGKCSDAALHFVAEALAGDGWHHTLPVLARIAPDAIERVRDIVLAHRRLEINAHRPTEPSQK